MGSQRLPGKVLADVAGRPLLSYMLERVRRCRTVDQVVVATSTSPEDEAIEALCKREEVACFRGSQQDVLDRYYQAARHIGQGHEDALVVVRLTADCPLIDPAIVDEAVRCYRAAAGKLDYVSNTVTRTYPDGLDVEVFSFQALARAWREARRPEEREHVTPYMIRANGHAGAQPPFRLGAIHSARNYAHWRWTVDYPEDLALIERLFSSLYPSNPTFGLQETLAWLRDHPEVTSVNRTRAVEAYQAKRLAGSSALLDRARETIPAQTQTLSKRITQLAQGVAPAFLQRGQGCRVEDVDGNSYLDYSMGLCALILGYRHPAVDEAIRRQLEDGILFSLPHRLEVELAERLIRLIPCAEMARFFKNGSDATAAAVRVARAYTGRERVAICGYHGAQDWYIGTTSWSLGVPASTKAVSHTFSYNNLASLESLFKRHPGEFAAVVLEPVGVTPPAEGFLQGVIDLAHRYGALVIFDEIITGFRLRLGGAQELFGVVPDLACFGKALANGMPLAALVGRRDVMRTVERVFISYTFGGETLSLAAAMATLDVMVREDGIAHLWAVGRQLQEGCQRLIDESRLASRVQCVGYPPRHVFRFLDEQGQESRTLKTLFLQETIRRGILTMGAHNLSLAHAPADVSRTLEVYREVFQILRQAVEEARLEDYLQVPVVEPVFRAVA